MKNPPRRLPDWLKQEIPSARSLEQAGDFASRGVNTVCVEAKCPNLGRCWRDKKLTFLILGRACTRSCRFCSVDKSGGRLPAVDPEEPRRIARAAKELGLSYAVITSVTRDDLADGGAGQFALTVAAIRATAPGVPVEVLVPDFLENEPALKIVSAALPEVIAHNLETVSRLYSRLRPEADYHRSLRVLRRFKDLSAGSAVKSSLMLGLSETRAEVVGAMNDLKDAGCDILTLGQYLAPSPDHEPVSEFISPETFREYEKLAEAVGFKAVLSGPLVRSSFRAEKVYLTCRGGVSYV